MKGGGFFHSKKKSDNVILTFDDLQGMVKHGISIIVSDGFASIEGQGKNIAKKTNIITNRKRTDRKK